ncbi:MAG TPA: response regulator [Polyangiaceae bacterium]|nr:response regulator [Polyangiaceae bacterium]
MQKGKILVVDDSEVVLNRIRLVLEQAGFDVVTTSQTVGAARHLRGVDLVILDYHMPGITGEAVAQSLRAAADAVGISPDIYLYTSDPSVSQHLPGFDGGFSRKGDDEALLAQVDAAFRLKRLRDAGKARRQKR